MAFLQQVFPVQLMTAVETWTSAPSPVAMVGLSSDARGTEITPEQLSCGELAVLKGQVGSSVERAIDMMEMFVSIEDEVDADKTICAMETGDVQDLGETGPSEVPVQKGIENIEASCSWITTFLKKKENSSIHGFQVKKHHYHYLYHVHRYILRL
ncbi:uncharacterized protein LOC128174660 [Crassostrea angulata]|uniref:uncharacterized protein LOC128174660 n=1 Tax=Magallana angulata TaxID=2784310 RepID=UPI0022B10F4C|nr:uncharacterized protein LOC128174660 [Crassostrea angulata]